MIGDIIAYAIFGLIVGALARLVLPGRHHMGCIATILAGIAGSYLAGFVVRLVTANKNYQPRWIASVLGAMFVVWLVTRSQRSNY